MLIELRGGLTVPEEPYRLVFALQDRGLTLTADGETLRVAGPNGSKPELSADDTVAIRKWKSHLMALLAYRAPEDWQSGVVYVS